MAFFEVRIKTHHRVNWLTGYYAQFDAINKYLGDTQQKKGLEKKIRKKRGGGAGSAMGKQTRTKANTQNILGGEKGNIN